MQYYIGIIHKDPDSDYGVSFPDFPGCISAGLTLQDALFMGSEALTGHMGLMVDEGEAIPEPSTMEAILADPDNRDGVPVLIPAPTLSSKAVRVNITIPEDTLVAIDRYAEAHGFTRSGFLTQAAKRVISDAA
jgi:predicted RNase H-like HicB family nuclease